VTRPGSRDKKKDAEFVDLLTATADVRLRLPPWGPDHKIEVKVSNSTAAFDRFMTQWLRQARGLRPKPDTDGWIPWVRWDRS